MPVSIIPDPNDPYFIPSVPMYRDFRKEIDLNESICDRFFEEQMSPKTKTPIASPELSRLPVHTDAKTQSKRLSELPAQKIQAKPMAEPPVPKVQAKPRPVSRRSLSQAREPTPTIIQPPMRFGNTPRRSFMTKGTTAEAVTVSSGPITRSIASAAKASSEQTSPKTKSTSNLIQEKSVVRSQPKRPSELTASKAHVKPVAEQPTLQKVQAKPVTEEPVPKVQAKPRPVSRRSLSQAHEPTPTIVQPPMRFGNTPRRSFMTKGTTAEAVTVSSGPITRSIAKASGVSHAVRGIFVVRNTSSKQQPKKDE